MMSTIEMLSIATAKRLWYNILRHQTGRRGE